jgi:hypothetical protein
VWVKPVSIVIDRDKLVSVLQQIIPQPQTTKQLIQQQQLNPSGSTTLLSLTTFKFAIILFHGDGDPQIQLTIQVGGNSYTLYGDEQAIELVANEQVAITANNTDTANPHNTPTIEIGYLTW